jgi:hypothetical protein
MSVFTAPLKAVDPTTGDTKANLRLDYPNYAGVLATAGNLVFLGHADGTFSDPRFYTQFLFLRLIDP